MTVTFEIPDQSWIIEQFGTSQLTIHMEELAELIQAISKYQRHKDIHTKQQIIEEMADCLICFE